MLLLLSAVREFNAFRMSNLPEIYSKAAIEQHENVIILTAIKRQTGQDLADYVSAYGFGLKS